MGLSASHSQSNMKTPIFLTAVCALAMLLPTTAGAPNIFDQFSDACSCEYHSGDCVISVAAPKGYFCSCNYVGFWTCTGDQQECVSYGFNQVSGEACNGRCKSKECCEAYTPSDCGGY